MSQANEFVSPISICNKTGYPIKAFRVTQNSEIKNSLEIPVLETLNFEIDSTEIRNLDFTKETLKIAIEGYPDIENIFMNKLTSFSKEIADGIFVIVEISLSETTKLLVVRSEFVVINETDYSFGLKFTDGINYSEQMCKPGFECPVPLLYNKSTIGLKPLQYYDKS